MARPKGRKTDPAKLRRKFKGGKAVPIPPGGIVLNDLPWFDPSRGLTIERGIGDHEVASGAGLRSGCYWIRRKDGNHD